MTPLHIKKDVHDQEDQDPKKNHETDIPFTTLRNTNEGCKVKNKHIRPCPSEKGFQLFTTGRIQGSDGRKKREWATQGNQYENATTRLRARIRLQH